MSRRLHLFKRITISTLKKSLIDVLVSWRSQGQDYGVGYLQHRLQDRSNHNEEDDGEEEGSVNDLELDEASLDGEDQQGDAFCHPPEETGGKQTCTFNKRKATYQETPSTTNTQTYAHTDLCMVLSFIKAL